MNAIRVKRNGAPEELALEEGPDLAPSAEMLLVEVEAAGINFIDVYQRKGIYDLPKPYTPGFEGVGRVLAAPGDSPFKQSDRISWINVFSSYAERILVPVHQAIRIPPQFTREQALLFQGVTAQYLVKEYRPIQTGETALVHAAAGGVGQLLVQWLKHLGAVVIATASSAQKLQTVRVLGADHLINYAEADFVDAVREITNGTGADIAFDAVGKATLEKTVACIAPRGTAVTYGSASGTPPAIEAASLIASAKRLAGGSIFTYTREPREMQERAAEVIEGIQRGWLKIAPGTAYPLKNAAQAHRDIESRKTEGKLYLEP